MKQLYTTLLYEPTLNLLVFLYNIVPGNDLGVAIILLTIIIKLILYPFSVKSIKSQRELQKIQPQIAELQKKYKDQKETMSKELMALYRREKINPFSSCFPLLIQLPFLIAVFQVFGSGLSTENLTGLYPFIHNPVQLNHFTLGIFDLSKGNLILAALAGLAQFWQSRMLVTKKPPMNVPGSKDESMTAAMNKQMVYFMPLITVLIGAKLPGGLALYWFFSTLLTIAQQYYMFRKDTKPQLPKVTTP